jgi:hypothetical protein
MSEIASLAPTIPVVSVMGTSKPTKGKQRVSNNPTSSETPIKHRKAKSQMGQDDVPGVQKIKAALRQTKRLLQKVCCLLNFARRDFLTVFFNWCEWVVWIGLGG